MGFPAQNPLQRASSPSLSCFGSGLNPRGLFLGLRELSRDTKQVDMAAYKGDQSCTPHLGPFSLSFLLGTSEPDPWMISISALPVHVALLTSVQCARHPVKHLECTLSLYQLPWEDTVIPISAVRKQSPREAEQPTQGHAAQP